MELHSTDLSKLNDRLRVISSNLNSIIMSRWKQAELKIELRAEASGDIIFEIYDVDSGMSHPIERRSEGLRQFITLSSFLRSLDNDVAPIILVDEIEQHLHLKAQAELVDFFEKQTFAAQVIFSTHSSGSLPQDLNNVRAVVNNSDGTSVIRNRPWQEPGNQVVSLFNLLGAGAFIFAALRAAVVTEGNVDAMMYLSMFRESVELPFEKQIGFQCIPGLASNRDQANYSDQSIRVAYIVDGDDAGKSIQQDLLQQGVSISNIFALEDGLSIEGYINSEVLLDAINFLLNEVGRTEKIGVAELEKTGSKIKTVGELFHRISGNPLDKKRLASKILDFEREGRKILDPSKKAYLSSVF